MEAASYSPIKYVIIPYITMDRTPSQSALLPAAQALDRAPPPPPSSGAPGRMRSSPPMSSSPPASPTPHPPRLRPSRGPLPRLVRGARDRTTASDAGAGRTLHRGAARIGPTKNLALAALRHFFDALVIRHAVALNPFSSVRGKKHSVMDGKTPQLAIQQARDLLASIDLSHVVGLRDRALLGTLAYTGARVGALARLRRGDLEDRAPSASCGSGKRGASSARSPSATTSIAGSRST